jgi:hypothetical protein
VGVGVATGGTVGVRVTVGTAEPVGVGVLVGVGVAVLVAVGVAVTVGVGVGVGGRQVLSKMITLLESWFTTARSGRTSPLKSPVATETGTLPAPTGEPEAGANPPIPSPSRIVTLLEN